jgi:SEC-C motif-containing protein
MRTVDRNDPCPCGSQHKFKKYCGPALSGDQWPATPEALMRSRYSAYVTGNVVHLWRTTHPANEAVQGLSPEAFNRRTLAYCRQVEFLGLTVHQTWPPDAQGVARVSFTARYRSGGREGAFGEVSEFVRLEPGWVYLRGVVADE